MKDLDQLKRKIEINKARLQKQETMMKIKERKARTRSLIEIGGPCTKS